MIRQVNEKDIAELADIYNYYIENTVVSYEEAVLGKEEMQDRVNAVLEAGYPWLVADEDGRLVGYCYAYAWNQRVAYRHTAEITVYLLPQATGQGWGTLLYQSLFEALKARGIRSVVGGIGLPNPASIALHEKMGLKKVAHFERVGYKFDQWLDVGYWQGDLQEI